MQILNDFFALKILLIYLNKSTLCQSILKFKKVLMAILSTKKQQDYAIIRTYLKHI